MSITFLCPGCRQRYTAPDGAAGMTTPCKKCGLALVVPSPASAAAPPAAAAAPPAAPAPPPQTGPRDLLDLLEDVAASSTVLPPAQPTLAPLGPAVRWGQPVRRRFEWGRFLKRLVSSPAGVALVIATAGLAVFVVLLIAPAAAAAWAKLCLAAGLIMILTAAIWYLCIFFRHADQRDIGVLVVYPVFSAGLAWPVGENMGAIIGTLGRHVTLAVIIVYGLCNLATGIYGLWWLIWHWRWTWQCFCVYLLGIGMAFGASLGGGSVRGAGGRVDRMIAAPERRPDDAARGRADAPPEVAPFAPAPVPRPADSPQPSRPFGDLPPGFGPGAGPGPQGFGPQGFGPQGIPAARRGRPTELVGGSGGEGFETAGSGEPVLGFGYRPGRWAGQEAIGDLRPLFARGPQGAQQVTARDGYAVGALEVDAAEFVNAVRVVFMRVDAQGRLDRNDSYQSDWIGAASGRPTRTVGGDGSKILGIYGRRMAVLDAVGLLLE